MDLHDYLHVLRRRWHFVVACVLLGLAAAVTVTALTPSTYTAKAQLFIATRDDDSAEAYQGGLFTQQRVKSYTQIADSTAVLRGVISELDLNTVPGKLAPKISAKAPLDTTLVDIQVVDPSAARAQQIADETANQLTRYIADIEKSSPDAKPLVTASVVGDSQPPSTPTSPRLSMNLAVGLFAGIVVGVGGAVLRNTLDLTVRSAGDVSRHLQVPTVGVVPGAGGRGRTGGAGATAATRRAEAFGQLRTRLQAADGDRPPASVLVTSALPGEGRTGTAVDLARSFTRTGRRVVLVEADLRRPHLAADLGLRGSAGLAGVLTGRTELYDALQPWQDGLLRVLPAGDPVPSDPSALLSSGEAARTLRALEAEADLVVVDSPPLLPFADAAALASATEGVLLVVRTGRTRRDLARRALDSLTAVRARVLGVVLTSGPADGITGRSGGPRRTARDGEPPVRGFVRREPAGRHE